MPRHISQAQRRFSTNVYVGQERLGTATLHDTFDHFREHVRGHSAEDDARGQPRTVRTTSATTAATASTRMLPSCMTGQTITNGITVGSFTIRKVTRSTVEMWSASTGSALSRRTTAAPTKPGQTSSARQHSTTGSDVSGSPSADASRNGSLHRRGPVMPGTLHRHYARSNP